MDLLTFLYPTSLSAVLIVGLVALKRTGQRSPVTKFCGRAFIFLVTIYMLAFGVICFDPYWIDDGVEEFISWSDRWSWAVVYASGFEILLFPFVLLGIVFSRSSKRWHSANRSL